MIKIAATVYVIVIVQACAIIASVSTASVSTAATPLITTRLFFGFLGKEKATELLSRSIGTPGIFVMRFSETRNGMNFSCCLKI